MAALTHPSGVVAPSARDLRSRVARYFEVKGTAVGMSLFNAWSRTRHRFGSTDGLRIRQLDHITIPCHDLAVAEAFYVGLLGARVMLRIDAAFLTRMGRPPEELSKGVHLSVVFSSGTRIDLFGYGSPPPVLAAHPHYAFGIPPGEMLRWKTRLERAGVPTSGPRRLGPPGQASLYFNDPSGNHLELVTDGFVQEIPLGAPDMASLEYVWKQA